MAWRPAGTGQGGVGGARGGRGPGGSRPGSGPGSGAEGQGLIHFNTTRLLCGKGAAEGKGGNEEPSRGEEAAEWSGTVVGQGAQDGGVVESGEGSLGFRFRGEQSLLSSSWL